MGLVMRPSNPALIAVGRALKAHRDRLVEQWSRWIRERMSHAPTLDRPTLERQLALLVDILVEMAGPLRRQLADLWFTACDVYGRSAAARGLAAGEIVEEIQHLREILITHLSETVAALPPRQGLASTLRLNRLVDKGIAHAVVGYTDALVETLLNRQGIPISSSDPDVDELAKRLVQLEEELAGIRRKNSGIV